MKLRLRPCQSKETLKIEVPNSCTLPQLRQILSEILPDSPLPASIFLSLNRKDEIRSEGADTLQSMGIAAGDLIYYSVEQRAPAIGSNSQGDLPHTTDSPTSLSNDRECSTSLNPQNILQEADDSGSVTVDSKKMKIRDTSSQMEVETSSNMEVDDEYDENNRMSNHLFDVVDSFSVPGFLRKVFSSELGDDAGRDHKLIVIAVHAVLLESGFVGFDDKAKVVVDGFQLRNEWPSGLFSVSLFYTLRESLGSEAKNLVVLKFQNLGKYINVYGTLGKGSGKRVLHRVQLNEDELVPFLNVVWANCGDLENLGLESSTTSQKEVFKFWRIVKDNLALPLLIDFCEEAGLELPPCFMRLPTDLKLKILESLPGVDLAKVNCVCSELRYLGSSDDLWKVKVNEEFSSERKEGQLSWKSAFSMAWRKRMVKRGRGSPYWPMPMPMPMPMPYWPQPRRRRYPNYPNPLFQRVPMFLGDESVAPPARGDDLQTRLDDPVIHPMRQFSPVCNLGVRGGRFI